MAEQTEYVDKNKTCSCRGNKEADRLFCMMESNGVLSDAFKSKITNILYMIICSPEGNEDEIKSLTKQLSDEMEWLNIFSPNFIKEVRYTLIGALIYEVEKL